MPDKVVSTAWFAKMGTGQKWARLVGRLIGLAHLAQRVEVDRKEVRIMGSKSVLLRTLVAASIAKTAGFGVPSFVPKWRARGDSNLWMSAVLVAFTRPRGVASKAGCAPPQPIPVLLMSNVCASIGIRSQVCCEGSHHSILAIGGKLHSEVSGVVEDRGSRMALSFRDGRSRSFASSGEVQERLRTGARQLGPDSFAQLSNPHG
jgi:hypothetical protein